MKWFRFHTNAWDKGFEHFFITKLGREYPTLSTVLWFVLALFIYTGSFLLCECLLNPIKHEPIHTFLMFIAPFLTMVGMFTLIFGVALFRAKRRGLV